MPRQYEKGANNWRWLVQFAAGKECESRSLWFKKNYVNTDGCRGCHHDNTRVSAYADDITMTHERHGISNHWPLTICLTNAGHHLFNGVCGNPPLTDGFLAQRVSHAENISMSLRHHDNTHMQCRWGLEEQVDGQRYMNVYFKFTLDVLNFLGKVELY